MYSLSSAAILFVISCMLLFKNFIIWLIVGHKTRVGDKQNSDGMDAIPRVFCLARKSLGQASDLTAGCSVLLVCLLNQGWLGWAVGEI